MFYRVLLGIIIIILLEISFDHNTMFYRVLLGIRIIILLEISCDSRDSRQDSKDSGKIRRFQRDSWSCRRDSESCRTPRPDPRGPLSFHLLLQMDREYCTSSITGVQYTCMVTTNG